MGLLKVTFGGVEIPVKIMNVNRNIAPPTKNNTMSIGNRDGVTLISSSRGENVIQIDYMIRNGSASDLRKFRRKTAGIISSKETKRLIFSDEPNLYYNAILDAQPTLEEEHLLSTGTIVFLVPDGVAHSTVETTFKAEENGEGIWEATVVNNGTEAAPIDFNVKIGYESGYLGIVSEYGVLQYGRAEEADDEIYTFTDTLFNKVPGSSILGWTAGEVNRHNTNFGVGGTMATRNLDGKSWLHLTGVVANSLRPDGMYKGATRTYTLPEAAEDWYCYSFHRFETGYMGQTALQQLIFIGENNEHLVTFNIQKGDMTGNSAYAHWHAIGMRNPTTPGAEWRIKYFTPSNRDDQNPYNNGRGHNDLMKIGNKLRIYWWGGYETITIPELANRKLKKIQVYLCQQMPSRNTNSGLNGYVSRNDITDITLQRLNVSAWRDVPNRFTHNSEFFINGRERNLYVDGMLKTQDEMTGSRYFNAPPGETKVQFYVSSFSEIVSASAKITEAYL